LEAQGEVARFEELLPQYERAPQVTRERIYLETMEEVLGNTSKIMVDSKGGNNMMYLPLDKIMERQQSTNNKNTRNTLEGLQAPVTDANGRSRNSSPSTGLRGDSYREGR